MALALSEGGGMSHEIEPFYDSLAEVYHLIFEDWDRAIARQGRVPEALIRRKTGPGPLRILDCACGIGTPGIGAGFPGPSGLGIRPQSSGSHPSGA